MIASPPIAQPARTIKLWLWPNLLSLDAPAVAVLWQALFMRCFRVRFDALAAILLPLTVWLIYSADRLFDARAHSRALPRHEFHGRHWRAIIIAWIAAFAAAGWMAVWRLPGDLFERGLGLLIATAVYFALVHLAPRLRWPKECAVAILFAAGVSLAAWRAVRSPADILTIAVFCCLCWINCAAIEQWERPLLSCDRLTAWPVRAAAIAVGLTALLLLHDRRPILGGAETLSAFAFAALDGLKNRLSADALRVLADVALLTPALFLPLAFRS